MSNKMIQLDPPIPVITPKGKAIAHGWIDYGIESNLMWVCFQDDTGECWTWPNPDIRAQENITARRENISPVFLWRSNPTINYSDYRNLKETQLRKEWLIWGDKFPDIGRFEFRVEESDKIFIGWVHEDLINKAILIAFDEEYNPNNHGNLRFWRPL